MNPRAMIVVASVLALLSAPALFGQEDSSEASDTKVIQPGDIDATISGGFGGLIYPYLQPGVDIGVVDAGPATVSVGAVAEGGICALCAVITATSDWRVRSWYGSVMGRANVHIDALAEAVADSVSLDPYVGFGLGPRRYSFAVISQVEDFSVTTAIWSVVAGPHLGARVFGSDGSFFGYGELSYLLEFGFKDTTVEYQGYNFRIDDEYASGGFNVTLGLGFRL